ncbi:MAG: toxin [Patescibacteria group bacterium]|nr:toxin [Patescibacteria group bacterium]MBU1420866.1 toxin [Patescibacteria group bacterium]MBU2456676.1 toxin [Patescibacteria group bacterium]
MKCFNWNNEKNKKLKEERNVCFDDIVIAIENNKILDIIENKRKYPNQKVYIIEINNYAYSVPFVEDVNQIFLKTIIPSSKATKKYLIQK